MKMNELEPHSTTWIDLSNVAKWQKQVSEDYLEYDILFKYSKMRKTALFMPMYIWVKASK